MGTEIGIALGIFSMVWLCVGGVKISKSIKIIREVVDSALSSKVIKEGDIFLISNTIKSLMRGEMLSNFGIIFGVLSFLVFYFIK